MTLHWKRLVKFIAGRAYTWGLKKLTEQGEVKAAPVRKPQRSRKVH